jgi:hypothetical protein
MRTRQTAFTPTGTPGTALRNQTHSKTRSCRAALQIMLDVTLKSDARRQPTALSPFSNAMASRSSVVLLTAFSWHASTLEALTSVEDVQRALSRSCVCHDVLLKIQSIGSFMRVFVFDEQSLLAIYYQAEWFYALSESCLLVLHG